MARSAVVAALHKHLSSSLPAVTTALLSKLFLGENLIWTSQAFGLSIRRALRALDRVKSLLSLKLLSYLSWDCGHRSGGLNRIAESPKVGRQSECPLVGCSRVGAMPSFLIADVVV